MSIQERLDAFLKSIDDYIENKNLKAVSFKEDFRKAELLTLDEISKLTQDECFNYAYMLYQYADHIHTEKARLQTIIAWCNTTLNNIIADEINEFSQYTKYELKVAYITKENDVAKKVSDWKLVADSRLMTLEQRESIVRRKADCLIEKGKRK